MTSFDDVDEEALPVRPSEVEREKGSAELARMLSAVQSGIQECEEIAKKYHLSFRSPLAGVDTSGRFTFNGDPRDHYGSVGWLSSGCPVAESVTD